MTITGSCLCGAVHFEVTKDPLWAHNCHCSRCRKSRGAAFASNLFVPLDGFRYTEGEALVQSYKPPAAVRFTSSWCRDCGSSLPWRNESRGVYVIPMGALNEDPGVHPGAHIFVGSKAPWFTITDNLPQHPEVPGTTK